MSTNPPDRPRPPFAVLHFPNNFLNPQPTTSSMTNRDVARLTVVALVVPVIFGPACLKRDWSVCAPDEKQPCLPGYVCTDDLRCIRAPDGGIEDGATAGSTDSRSGHDSAPAVDSSGDFSTSAGSPDATGGAANFDMQAPPLSDASLDLPPDAPAVNVSPDAPAGDIGPDVPAGDVGPDVPPVGAPGTCRTDNDCSPSAPLCLGNRCARCSGDNDCSARSGTPACAVASGLCVPCVQNGHCAANPDRGARGDGGPGAAVAGLCDTTTNQCVECVQRSDCASACQACSAGACVAVKNQDDPGRCAGTCDGTSTCRSRQGQLCQTAAGGCLGGTSCSPDGYCCDSVCNDPCMSCDVQGHLGTCTVVTSGAPHSGHVGCGTDPQCMGACTGQADGKCTYPVAKTCGGGPICSGPSLIEQSTCSQGACVAPAALLCDGGFNCSGNACKSSCFATGDCQNDYVSYRGLLSCQSTRCGRWILACVCSIR
jgi:hypothetical protein